MGRLKTLPARVQPMAPRIGYASGDEKAGDKARNDAAPWRAWYRTKRWRDLRIAVFARDGFKCQRTGQLVIGKHPAPDSPVANHKRPHRGDPALFWDMNNIETVAKSVHDKLIQAEEQSIPTGRWD
ncbi:MAG: endonuclease [Devosia sp. 63-57]|nr:MAG: endonuclease [Pelagibacterium sp. SCN 63-126]ODU82738.1 MAG: endonuclease [Pelagibacterium sp. SCN 63-17]OJX45018.1 MAG: endonuclease [Devosia sp. 63-57]